MTMYITGKPLGGEAGLFGGEASPLPPPVDRTLQATCYAVKGIEERQLVRGSCPVPLFHASAEHIHTGITLFLYYT